MSVTTTDHGVHMIDGEYAVYKIVDRLSEDGVELREVAEATGLSVPQVEKAFNYYKRNQQEIHADVLREQVLQARDKLENKVLSLSALGSECRLCGDGEYEPSNPFPSLSGSVTEMGYSVLTCSECGESPTHLSAGTPEEHPRIERRFIDYDTGELVYQLADGSVVSATAFDE